MYCNAACKKRHRHKHKKDCEEHLKRAAEREAKLHDEQLFKQTPPLEDCPICMLRLPYIDSGRTYMSCCGKVLCTGCICAVQSRATKEEEDICPFCRTPPPTYEEELIKRYEKRMKLNDTDAIYNMGCLYDVGKYNLPQSQAKAMELWHRAGELGSSEAYYNIGHAYRHGEGVERDDTKAKHYYELAAIGGDPSARNTLGVMELQADNTDRALKHFLIAVKDGHEISLKTIKGMYMHGDATKDDYIKALQARRAYLDEIKSDQRDEAAAGDDDCKYY